MVNKLINDERTLKMLYEKSKVFSNFGGKSIETKLS